MMENRETYICTDCLSYLGNEGTTFDIGGDPHCKICRSENIIKLPVSVSTMMDELMRTLAYLNKTLQVIHELDKITGEF